MDHMMPWAQLSSLSLQSNSLRGSPAALCVLLFRLIEWCALQANWASGWWTACIDCSDEPFFWDLLTPPPGPLGLLPLLLLLPVVEVKPRSCKCLRCSGTLQKFKPCLKILQTVALSSAE